MKIKFIVNGACLMASLNFLCFSSVFAQNHATPTPSTSNEAPSINPPPELLTENLPRPGSTGWVEDVIPGFRVTYVRPPNTISSIEPVEGFVEIVGAANILSAAQQFLIANHTAFQLSANLQELKHDTTRTWNDTPGGVVEFSQVYQGYQVFGSTAAPTGIDLAFKGTNKIIGGNIGISPITNPQTIPSFPNPAPAFAKAIEVLKANYIKKLTPYVKQHVVVVKNGTPYPAIRVFFKEIPWEVVINPFTLQPYAVRRQFVLG